MSLILEKSVLHDSYTLSAFVNWIRKTKSQNSVNSFLHYLYISLTFPVLHLHLIYTILHMMSYYYSWGSIKLNTQFQNTVIYRFQYEHLFNLITALLCFAEWLLTNEFWIILHTSHINIRKQHMDAFIKFEHSAFSNNIILTLYCYVGHSPINEI
jgi:DNA integrity scanning protein DisA with diadenylate cyclase activity